MKTFRPGLQTSSHRTPNKPLPDLPDNITKVYTKQHKTLGLEPSYEGPFTVHSRPSKSTFKIIVGLYRNGEPRYEIRHANDLKIAHESSMAAPASRPALGRPTSSSKVSDQTEKKDAEKPVPKPTSGPPNIPPFCKQVDTATSGKIQTADQTPERRSVRSTRNPQPKYVDAIWQASPIELNVINRSIGSVRGP